jgi:hypothetical protein
MSSSKSNDELLDIVSDACDSPQPNFNSSFHSPSLISDSNISNFV